MTADERLAVILDVLQDMAAGDLAKRASISLAHDEIDALAHAVNVVGGELEYTTQRLSRARDEAEQASRAKSVFLRNVSHEMRTPLTAIVGITELLRTGALDAERRNELYERVLANGRSLVALIDDLLDLARVESDKVVIESRPMLLSAVVDDVVDSFEPQALVKRLTIHVEISPAHAVRADPRRVRQILVSLVGNAIKFTDRGEIALCSERRGETVVLNVTDPGIGLVPGKVDHLFEPFSQANPSISHRFGGTGLGLALSRRLARIMGGDLDLADAEARGGATFRLSLPAIDASFAIRSTIDAPSPSTPEDLKGLRLLIVDDHEDVRTPLALLLGSRGATVVEARGGSEAVELAARHTFDLILMDVRMPDLDGLEATRLLRGLGVRVPIVALTADVLDRFTEYLEAGYSAQFAKPIDIDRLVSTIRALQASATA